MANNFKPGSICRKTALVEVIRKATFPEVSEEDDERRRQWFESYITTILQRGVRQIADIAKLGVLPNLLKVLGGSAGGLINDADISRAIGQNAVTAKNYRVLLQMMFLTFDVKPWFRNTGKRLVKSPKGYIIDTALLCHLQQIDMAKAEIRDPHVFGHIFVNFVASELLKQLASSNNAAELYHFRTSDGKEVDFVLERADGRLAAIEAKGRDSATVSDFKGLKELCRLTKDDFLCGIVLYRGNKIIPFEKNMWLFL